MLISNTPKRLDLQNLISTENRTNGTLSALISGKFKEKPPVFQVGRAVFLKRERKKKKKLHYGLKESDLLTGNVEKVQVRT
jgi:hypothetical protein